MRIAVAGALAAKPHNGGEAWVRLSYVLGFRRLGADVVLLEELDAASPEAIGWFRAIADRYGIPATLVDPSGCVVDGPAVDDADALVNVSGNLRAPRLLHRFARRAYVDLDPCFTQMWHATGAVSLDGHHVYFTVGENVGTRRSIVPTGGLRWRATRPPVVLADWPELARTRFDRFTTVSTWRPGHGSVVVGGEAVGLRVHAFRRLADLPRRTSLPFEAALAIDPAEASDLESLRAGGWRLVPPDAVAGDPEAFRTYVRGSGAEFSVAQEAYTATRTGWLSDRTARYLACGRPALVSDTGNTAVPTGRGLVTFSSPEEARDAAQALVADYETHCAAARSLAVEYFDSDVVLTRLLEDLL